MKIRKFMAYAMAMTMPFFVASCGDDDKNDDEPTVEDSIVLNKKTATIEEGATVTVKVKDASNPDKIVWETEDEDIATVEDGVITGVKAGETTITATCGKAVAEVAVTVTAKAKEDPENPSEPTAQGSVWPIILDGATAESFGDKIAVTFQPDDQVNFLYFWENTYVAGEGAGLNAAGNAEGYTAVKVSTVGWSGLGFCLTPSSPVVAVAEALRQAIVADPDKYFLHLSIKSNDNASHTFYIMNNDKTKFVIGDKVFDGGTIIGNFTRDGEWYDFDIPMADYVNALASQKFQGADGGGNIFVALSGGVEGTELNLDQVYFYKK